MNHKVITAKEMQLADTIGLSSLIDDAWRTAVVKQIKDGYVTLFRPYVHTEDFSYTGGVICYIGFEEFTISQNNSMEYTLLDRKELK